MRNLWLRNNFDKRAHIQTSVHWFRSALRWWRPPPPPPPRCHFDSKCDFAGCFLPSSRARVSFVSPFFRIPMYQRWESSLTNVLCQSVLSCRIVVDPLSDWRRDSQLFTCVDLCSNDMNIMQCYGTVTVSRLSTEQLSTYPSVTRSKW